MSLKERIDQITKEIIQGKSLLKGTLSIEEENPSFEEINNAIIKLDQQKPVFIKGLSAIPLYWNGKYGFATSKGNNNTTMVIINKDGTTTEHGWNHIFSNAWGYNNCTGSAFGKIHGKNVVPHFMGDQNNQRLTLMDIDSGEVLYHSSSPIGYVVPNQMFAFDNKIFYVKYGNQYSNDTCYIYYINEDFTIDPASVKTITLCTPSEIYWRTSRIFMWNPTQIHNMEGNGLLFYIVAGRANASPGPGTRYCYAKSISN